MKEAGAMEKDAKIYVAGHRGMVGSAIVRKLTERGYWNIITRTRAELDLFDQAAVCVFMAEQRPDYLFLAAAKVGGIQANHLQPADFIYENLVIQSNVIQAANLVGVQRLLFLGSSCIYPRECPQPIKEEYLLAGPLEPTNESYALAKIAGVKLCESINRQYGRNYVSAMPTNLYGPNDNYDLNTAHVFAALLRKTHEAKQRGDAAVELWGSGRPRREFMHVDDMADACVFLMERPDITGGLFNVGTGTDLIIEELARKIISVVGFRGGLTFDRSKPDGTPRKLLDVEKLRQLGWQARIELDEGIAQTYQCFLETQGVQR